MEQFADYSATDDQLQFGTVWKHIYLELRNHSALWLIFVVLYKYTYLLISYRHCIYLSPLFISSVLFCATVCIFYDFCCKVQQKWHIRCDGLKITGCSLHELFVIFFQHSGNYPVGVTASISEHFSDLVILLTSFQSHVSNLTAFRLPFSPLPSLFVFHPHFYAFIFQPLIPCIQPLLCPFMYNTPFNFYLSSNSCS